MTVSVRGLTVRFGERSLFKGLEASFAPGLHWVTGDEGSGKSTLLAVLAGRVAATLGEVVRPAGSVFLESTTDAELDARTPEEWLAGQLAIHPAWCQADAEAMIERYALGPHRSKPFFQLSAGSRRKVGLVAAQASGAVLTMLDGPFAALDVPGLRALADTLHAAARGSERIWVVADYLRPDDAPWGSVLNLDDRRVAPAGSEPSA